LFLVSGDGKKVVIGEAKNELSQYSFTQVVTRKSEFDMIDRDVLPERLKN
jgi:hypothetical protein